MHLHRLDTVHSWMRCAPSSDEAVCVCKVEPLYGDIVPCAQFLDTDFVFWTNGIASESTSEARSFFFPSQCGESEGLPRIVFQVLITCALLLQVSVAMQKKNGSQTWYDLKKT